MDKVVLSYLNIYGPCFQLEQDAVGAYIWASLYYAYVKFF